jgi:hypothetical protein
MRFSPRISVFGELSKHRVSPGIHVQRPVVPKAGAPGVRTH